MTSARRAVLSAAVAATLTISTAAATTASARATGPAPGGPGKAASYLGSNKTGFGTSTTRGSHVWFTLQRGGTGELYYPDLGTPAASSLGFVVADGSGKAVRAGHGSHRTDLADSHSLTYRETDFGANGTWRLVTTYVTDPRRSTVLANVAFTSLNGKAYRLYVLYEPTLSNAPSDDSGRTAGAALIASDTHAASALTGRPAFTATSTGYRGTSDGWKDLSDNGTLDNHYTSAGPGNIVQTAQTPLTGRAGHRTMLLSLGFGPRAASALSTARASAAAGFRSSAQAYAAGWRRYLGGLHPVPTDLRTARQREEYVASEMVLAASEDKTHPGAYVASPTMPWAWGGENPTGPYHLVWSRDLYEIATALIADGDRAGANRALSFLFDKQQKPDGSFPQNSTVSGKPFWTGLQLDEVADPIVLAYQLHRWGHAS